MNIEWHWQQENAKLRLENQELQKALSFYADKDNYKYKLGEFRGVRRIVKVEMDGGKTARKTLEGLRSGSSNDNHEKSQLGRAT